MKNTTEIGTFLLVGKRGSGKTQLSKKIIRGLHVPKNNRFIISPTIDLDDTLHSFFYKENRFNKFSPDVLDTILDIIKDDRKEADEKFYFRINEDGEKERIQSRVGVKNPNYPEFLLMLDDSIEAIGGGVRPKALARLTTRHRHYKLNMIMTSQLYTSVSPVIRANIMKFYIFSTNKKEIKKLCDEHSIFDKTKEFEDYFREITDKPYTPFVINYFYPTKKIYNDNSVKPDVTELSKTKIEKIENK